MSVDQLLFS